MIWGMLLNFVVWIKVVYHLHGQTSRFTVWANGKQISVLANSVRDWRLPFAEIPTIYKKICTTATANENVTTQKP